MMDDKELIDELKRLNLLIDECLVDVEDKKYDYLSNKLHAILNEINSCIRDYDMPKMSNMNDKTWEKW